MVLVQASPAYDSQCIELQWVDQPSPFGLQIKATSQCWYLDTIKSARTDFLIFIQIKKKVRQMFLNVFFSPRVLNSLFNTLMKIEHVSHQSGSRTFLLDQIQSVLLAVETMLHSWHFSSGHFLHFSVIFQTFDDFNITLNIFTKNTKLNIKHSKCPWSIYTPNTALNSLCKHEVKAQCSMIHQFASHIKYTSISPKTYK